MTSGRPRNNAPKTAYDVRRYITLVQVLALGGIDDKPLRELCALWGVTPQLDHLDARYLNIWGTIRALAQHVIEYHQEDTKTDA